jgi:glutathione-regulated potassium-efflux system ancillary protein KefG
VSQRVLVLFAHPALQKSRVNKRLLQEPQAIDGVTVHDLYEAYPRFDIDVAHEQQLLIDHEVLVLQHPFYWYSTPSILKEWQDLVLEHGWAYGSEGNALRGKRWMHVVSTGGREEAYTPSGFQQLTVRQLLAPLERTALLCGMRFLAPFIVHGTHSMQPADIDLHAADYREVLRALCEGRIDEEAVAQAPRLNADLSRVILQKKGA